VTGERYPPTRVRAVELSYDTAGSAGAPLSSACATSPAAGRPAAVVLSIADLEGLEETLEILSNPQLMRRMRKAGAEIDSGKSEVLTKDEALARIRRK
jgi:hypothetical protein